MKAALERLQERHGTEIALHPEPALAGSPIPAQRFRWDPVGITEDAPPRPLREAPQPATTGATLSRNLGDFDCSPRLAKVATLNRQAAAATHHADERHGVKAARKS